VRHSQADVSRACADLGYRPTTDVPTGLRACLEWWRERGNPVRTAGAAAAAVA
jgi:nucleoside-diphosphate-sugar epimerase